MNVQDYFDIVARAKKEFDNWVAEKSYNFKCLQFVFPFVDTDKVITTWIFFLNNGDIVKYAKDGTIDLIKNNFTDLLIKHGLPKNIVASMKFEVDSDENVKNNYEGNYFYRLR